MLTSHMTMAGSTRGAFSLSAHPLSFASSLSFAPAYQKVTMIRGDDLMELMGISIFTRKMRKTIPSPPPRGVRATSSGSSSVGSRSFYEAKLRRRSNARKCTLGLALSLGALTIVYQAMWSYWLAGVNIPDVDHDPVTGQDRIRRRPDLSTKFDPTLQNQVHTEPFDAIMEAFFTLVDIQIPPEGLFASGGEAYSNVQASFCQLSWSMQHADPKRVPLFDNMKQKSFLCSDTMVTTDLYHIARQAEEYDAGTNQFAATTKPKGFQVVPPTAMIFHESHAGSTLTSTILASSEPEHIHVYSEAPATRAALLACDNGVHCDAGAQEKLIKDVFYLMGRMNRPAKPQNVFFKMDSVTVRSIDVFRQAFPTVPWVFLYRDANEVMASHLHEYHDSSLLLSDQDVPSCLRERHNQWQHPQLLKVVQGLGKSLDSLTAEEYCAAHLASLAQSAVDESQKPSSFWAKHMIVKFDDLPFILWDRVIPDLDYMSQPVSLRIDAMHETSKYYYTAASANHMGQQWQEDTGIKQGQATDTMKKAAEVFLGPVHGKLEELRIRQVV